MNVVNKVRERKETNEGRVPHSFADSFGSFATPHSYYLIGKGVNDRTDECN